MDEFKYSSLEELYQKVLPALNTKVADLKRHNIRHIEPEDIWKYLKTNYWRKADTLSLADIVNDILSTPNEELELYMLNIKKKPKIKKDDTI